MLDAFQRWLTVFLSYIRPAHLRLRLGNEEGQGLIEYALILILVVLVGFILVIFVGGWATNTFTNIVNSI